MFDVNWGLFLVASLSINAIPGADVIYVTGKYNSGGWRAAAVSAAGLALGYYFYVFITWVGLTALLVSEPSLFSVIHIAGALYLIWMGYNILKSSPVKTLNAATSDFSKDNNKKSGFSGGVIISVLNPKVGLFFVSFFPQFIHSSHTGYLILILGSIFCLGATLFNFLYCFILTQVNRLAPAKSHLILGVIPGVILILLGVFMIAEVAIKAHVF